MAASFRISLAADLYSEWRNRFRFAPAAPGIGFFNPGSLVDHPQLLLEANHDIGDLASLNERAEC
jgi:hypothetical protein